MGEHEQQTDAGGHGDVESDLAAEKRENGRAQCAGPEAAGHQGTPERADTAKDGILQEENGTSAIELCEVQQGEAKDQQNTAEAGDNATHNKSVEFGANDRHTPVVLLVDELSLGLAPLVFERLLLAVRAAADRGAAILLVEQHIRQALEVADRAYVLSRGQVALEGPGQEMLGRIDEIEQTYLAVAELEK